MHHGMQGHPLLLMVNNLAHITSCKWRKGTACYGHEVDACDKAIPHSLVPMHIPHMCLPV